MPKGIIIIGTGNPADNKILQEHRNILSRNIEIMTYNDIVSRSKQTIQTLKELIKKPRPRKRTIKKESQSIEKMPERVPPADTGTVENGGRLDPEQRTT